MDIQLSLREASVSDEPDVARLLADRALQHLLLAYPPTDKPSADASIWLQRRIGNDELACRVISDDCGTFLGFFQVTNIHRRGRFGWMGMALTPQARGRGIGAWTLASLLDFAANKLGLQKLLLEVRHDNLTAIKLYERQGFRHVGKLEAHYDDGEQKHDVRVMERLLGDFER